MRQQERGIIFVCVFFLLSVVVPTKVTQAHGINGHIHVTAWSMADLQDMGLRALLEDADVVDAMLFGAAFPDTGYASDKEYGEPAHWEPFVERLVAHVRRQYPPPYVDLEDRKRVAFIMGLAAHGLQDEIFDTLFLVQVDIHDGATQDDVDPATDAFLEVDGHLEYKPAIYAPISDLIEVFAQSGVTVDEATIQTGMSRVKTLVIDYFSGIAQSINADLRPRLGWTLAHYLDETVPGSLTSEVPATAAYMEAVWARLHGRPPMVGRVAYGFPESPRRTRSVGPGVDAWVTLVFGQGVRVGSINQETVKLLDGSGSPVEMQVTASRWTHDADSVSRLLVVKPVASLQYDHGYTIELNPGLQYVDGSRLVEQWTYGFQTPCAPGMEANCAVEEEPVGDLGSIGASTDGGPTQNTQTDAAANAEMGVTVRGSESGGDHGCAQLPGDGHVDMWLLLLIVGTMMTKRHGLGS
jgi:hypothetical protein